MKKSLFTLTLVAFILFLLSSCSKENSNYLVGTTWESEFVEEGIPGRMELLFEEEDFRLRAYAIINDEEIYGGTIEGKYVIDDDYLTLTSSGSIATGKIKGNKITLYDSEADIELDFYKQ